MDMSIKDHQGSYGTYMSIQHDRQHISPVHNDLLHQYHLGIAPFHRTVHLLIYMCVMYLGTAPETFYIEVVFQLSLNAIIFKKHCFI